MPTKRVRSMFLLLAAIPLFAAAQGANQDPRVIPTDAKYRGLTYGEWAAEWWRAAFAIPVEGVVLGSGVTAAFIVSDHLDRGRTPTAADA